MSGSARCRFIRFQISIRCRAMPEECLYVWCLCDSCMCLYYCMFPNYGLMSGNAWGMFLCFRISVWRRAGPEDCLYVYVMWLFMCICWYVMCICWYVICILSFAQCRVGPDDGLCPMPDSVRCQARPDEGGGAHYMFIWDCMIMCMVCGSLGRLTNFHAYNFQFWFQVFPVARGRARDDCISHTMMLTWDVTLIYIYMTCVSILKYWFWCFEIIWFLFW